MDKKIRSLKIIKWVCAISLLICGVFIFGLFIAYAKTDNDAYRSFALVLYVISTFFYIFAIRFHSKEQRLRDELQDSEEDSH